MVNKGSDDEVTAVCTLEGCHWIPVSPQGKNARSAVNSTAPNSAQEESKEGAFSPRGNTVMQDEGARVVAE